MNNPFIGELIGTMLLIIFGDGVVANVVLNKTKGENSGWMVIATGWGMAIAVAVYASGPITRQTWLPRLSGHLPCFSVFFR